jgi:aminoglycoside phosphotransferase family enzyme
MVDQDSQQEVFALLGDPSTHGAAARRIDTHTASVFLAGDRAYKVKRSVRFPFLDYSTLAYRKAACEAELAVNRPFAPQIYEGTLPITARMGGSSSEDPAILWNGQWSCGASTRTRPSIDWRNEERSPQTSQTHSRG